MTDRAKTPANQAGSAGASRDLWQWLARYPAIVGGLLALVTALVYWRVADNDFVNYDDGDYFTANSHVQSGLTLENLKWAFTSGHASNWHPVTWISHMLDWVMFGAGARGPHLVNLCFHLANTVLLLLVLRQLTGALWRSAMVAALFALHPLHVESVAWISERKDVLSMFFFLLTLMAYTKYARSGFSFAGRLKEPETGERTSKPVRALKPDGKQPGSLPKPSVEDPSARRRSLGFFGLALILFALGLMSKPMLVTVPFVLLLLDYWPLRRVDGNDAKRWLRLALEKLPFFVLVIASSVVTIIVQRGAVSTSLTFGARMANAVVSYCRYIRKLFWPTDLSVLYPHPGHWPVSEVVACGFFLVCVSVMVIFFGIRRPYLFTGWFWYLGTLVPVIGIVQVGIQSMADRYTYIPAVGLFIMLVWGLTDLAGFASEEAEGVAEPGRMARYAMAAGGLAILGVCSWLTARQIHVWHDSETLFRQAVAVTEKNYLAYNNLGYYLANKGKTAEAMKYYEDSLAINPNYEDALNNLGYSYAGKRNFAKAIELYYSALRIRPQHPEVHDNLGNALAEMGRVDEAISHYLVTLKQKPDHADAHNNLGIALAMKGNLDEAIEHFHLAIKYKPNNASAHSNLGNALAAQHKLAEAAREYYETLRLKPDDPHAHNNLGNVLAEQGKVTEAIAEYEEAIRLNADNPEAEFNLGQALLRVNRRDEAIVHMKRALSLKPDYSQVRQQLETLGVAVPK